MNQDFGASLELTGVGMLAVIVALLVIALVIMLLGRLSNKKQDEIVEPEESLESVLDQVTVTANQSDEAAAIALAIGLQRRRNKGILRHRIDYTDTEIIGEVINVVGIDAGTGAWANADRLQSTR